MAAAARQWRAGFSNPATPSRAHKTPEQAQIERLRKENAALVRGKAKAEKKIAQTEAALDILRS
ncbi:hypothetical protein ACIBH1_06775 [Nonomuraea sp. NPDC050663]|uniref:hypothetical protein n=1 Tax=Nonomuraea sp. NPDC050663 TaxID=3364370 RepID=UPI00378ACE23